MANLRLNQAERNALKSSKQKAPPPGSQEGTNWGLILFVLAILVLLCILSTVIGGHPTYA